MASDALDFEKAMAEIITQYSTTVTEKVEKALTVTAKKLQDKLAAASPYDSKSTGKHLRDCWAVKTQYHGVRYVGNTKTVLSKDGTPPLTNILEYGLHKRPFISKTFEVNKSDLFSTFKLEITK